MAFEDLPDGRLRDLNPDYFGRFDVLVDILVAHDLVPVLQPVFHGFGWKGLDVAGTVVPEEDYARYCRYLVARYGARPGGLPRGRRRFGRRATGGGRRRGGARVGRVRPADRHPLPAARDQPSAPGAAVAGLPELSDRPRGGAPSGAGRRHVAQHPGQGGAEPGADLRAHPRTGPGRGVVAGPRGMEQPVRRRHDGGRLRSGQPVAVAPARRRAGPQRGLPVPRRRVARGGGLRGLDVRRAGRPHPASPPVRSTWNRTGRARSAAEGSACPASSWCSTATVHGS